MSNKSWRDRSRKLARERFWDEHDRETYRCPDCGRLERETSGPFHVHHKNGEPMDNRPENNVGLCVVCHRLRENKKPNLDAIRNLRDQAQSGGGETVEEVRSVYLAGSMKHNRTEHCRWTSSPDPNKAGTASVEGWRDVIPSTPGITINSPKGVGLWHGAGSVEGVAAADLELVEKSDAILAYFDKKEQVGTMTELLYALSLGKRALVLFDSDLVHESRVITNGDGVGFLSGSIEIVPSARCIGS